MSKELSVGAFLPKGEILGGNYRIEQPIPIGEGRHATVHLAERMRDGRETVAIKVFKEPVDLSEEEPKKDASPLALQLPSTSLLDLFQEEVKRHGSLDHPNIVPVYDHGIEEINGKFIPFIVMKHANAGTLGYHIRSGGFGTERSVEKLVEAAEALGHAHGRNVLHQDFTPDNILLHLDPNKFHLDLMVTDFGLATSAQSTDPGKGRLLGGSDPYMAPEKAPKNDSERREPVGEASDIYSLAVVSYETLTGVQPSMDSPTGPSSFEEVVDGDIMTETLDKLWPVVEKSLATEPGKRHQSAGDFSQDLRDIHEVAKVEEGKERTLFVPGSTSVNGQRKRKNNLRGMIKGLRKS